MTDLGNPTLGCSRGGGTGTPLVLPRGPPCVRSKDPQPKRKPKKSATSLGLVAPAKRLRAPRGDAAPLAVPISGSEPRATRTASRRTGSSVAPSPCRRCSFPVSRLSRPRDAGLAASFRDVCHPAPTAAAAASTALSAVPGPPLLPKAPPPCFLKWEPSFPGSYVGPYRLGPLDVLTLATL